MQHALRQAGALADTGVANRTTSGQIAKAIGIPASSRYTPPAAMGGMLAREAQKWSEERAAEDMPLWAKALTTGPVGGFLNGIQ